MSKWDEWASVETLHIFRHENRVWITIRGDSWTRIYDITDNETSHNDH